MGLLTKALVDALAAAGMVKANVAWSPQEVLGDWLRKQGIDESEPVLTQYFGVPYRFLPTDCMLKVVPNAEGQAQDVIYYAPMLQCYVCVRPPSEEARVAYHQQFGDAPLYITDEVAVHSALLRGILPALMASGLGNQREYELEALLRQGANHVDHMIGQILVEAVRADATDIHLFMRKEDFHIVFRVHGALLPYAVLTQTSADPLLNKLKLMAEMDIAEHRLPQDGHIQIAYQGATYHLRVGTLPLLDGEKLVIRILPERQRLTQLSALGFSEMQIQQLDKVLNAQQGLVLITGPTNSGKTTTLYACLQQMAAQGTLVYTIEDPVEAVLPQVQQSQVNVRGGFSFAAGLRGILRSDPDVLAVGELRDAETVDIAARAALSGHLVVATLHAFDAHQAVNRLRDLGLSDLLLSAVLSAVINQRLLEKPCAHCGGTGRMEDGQCCTVCMGSGSDGRSGVQEIWIPSLEERGQIEQGVSSGLLRQQAEANEFESWATIAEKKGLSIAAVRNEGLS